MKILLGTHYLKGTGGTECYTYALAMELKRLGHQVEYYAIEKGDVSRRLEEQGIPFFSNDNYDLILANHTTVVDDLSIIIHYPSPIIQTCHGKTVELEQPSPFATAHVAVSAEVALHLSTLGYSVAAIIYNGIDCERFFPERPVNATLQTVLSLCQGERAHDFVERCCKRVGLNFIRADKNRDNIWEIEKLINQADLVVGLGRSIYDAMACGRCALIYDFRDYIDAPLSDGMVMPDTIERSLTCNCCGRAFNIKWHEKSFASMMCLYYSPSLAKWSRGYAVTHFNIRKSVQKYLQVYEQLKRKNYEFT